MDNYLNEIDGQKHQEWLVFTGLTNENRLTWIYWQGDGQATEFNVIPQPVHVGNLYKVWVFCDAGLPVYAWRCPTEYEPWEGEWQVKGDKLIFTEPPAMGTFFWLFYEF